MARCYHSPFVHETSHRRMQPETSSLCRSLRGASIQDRKSTAVPTHDNTRPLYMHDSWVGAIQCNQIDVISGGPPRSPFLVLRPYGTMVLPNDGITLPSMQEHWLDWGVAPAPWVLAPLSNLHAPRSLLPSSRVRDLALSHGG
jgi:hypothetical protein